MRFAIPLQLGLLALLAYLIGIGRGVQLARYYNITARVLMGVTIFEWCRCLRWLP